MNREETRPEYPTPGGSSPLDVDTGDRDAAPIRSSFRDGVEQQSPHDPADAHLSAAEVARVRTVLNDGALEEHSSRMKWFLLGFVAALVALVVAAAVFLVVSDDDNDGQLNLDVPTVDVDVDG